jgi:hypothetical protein
MTKIHHDLYKGLFSERNAPNSPRFLVDDALLHHKIGKKIEKEKVLLDT